VVRVAHLFSFCFPLCCEPQQKGKQKLKKKDEQREPQHKGKQKLKR
jgi:hypothetical protein